METLKKLVTNFKKHSKIYIAFAMIITCVFGVMFATNTFAYNDNYNKISDTLDTSTLYLGNFNLNTTIKTELGYNNENYSFIEVQHTASDSIQMSFGINLKYGLNYVNDSGNYIALINLEFGYYSSSTGVWTTYTNSSQYLTAYCGPTSTTTNYGTQTRMLYYSQNDYGYNYKSAIIQLYNYNSANNFNNIIYFNFRLPTSVNKSIYCLRIYNIDIVPNNEIYTQQYIDTYYAPLENQYNQLLEDYETLEINYDTLNDNYTELQNNYDNLNDDYTQLQNDYDELERNRLQLLSAFDGCNVQLFDNSNILIMNENLSLPGGANYINLDNLPNIKNYLSNYGNNTYFYLMFNLNYSINNSLLFTFNNSVLEVDITISSTLNTFVETKTNMFNNANLYQLVINENYNSFNKIKFDGIYTPDYWNNLNISITIDGASYQNGYRDGMHEGEIYQDLYDDLFTRFRELQNQYDELLNSSEFTYDDGYNDGFNDAINNEFSNSGLNTLFNAILSYPVNFIKEVFNFNFMGVNIAGVITFILSIGIVAFIINYFRKH